MLLRQHSVFDRTLLKHPFALWASCALLISFACAPGTPRIPAPSSESERVTAPLGLGPSTAWPQFGNGPQHQSKTPDNVVPQGAATNGTGGTFAMLWGKNFYPEHVFSGQEPIVNNGTVLLGTMEGRLWALNDATGACRWVYPSSCASPYTSAVGPIGHSVAATTTAVYAATEYGMVYSINMSTGGLNWQTNLQSAGNLDIRTGISSAVLMDDNATPANIYVAQRSGVVSALNPTTGAIKWQVALGVPTYQTPSYDPANGHLFVESGDGKVRAIDTTATTPTCCLWTSPQLNGMGAHRLWTVVYSGFVIARTWADTTDEPRCGTCPNYATSEGIWPVNLNDYTTSNQATALSNYGTTPANNSISLAMLTESTGALTLSNQLVHPNQSLEDGGVSTPPCIDTVGNNLVIPARHPTTLTGGGFAGWAFVNLSTREATPITDSLTRTQQGNSTGNGGIFVGDDMGYGNIDGLVYCTMAGNGVLALQQEPTDTWQGWWAQTASFTGATAQIWTFIGQCQLSAGTAGGCISGWPGSGYWQEGGFPSGGGSPPVIVDNEIIQQSDEQLIARKAACLTPAAGCT